MSICTSISRALYSFGSHMYGKIIGGISHDLKSSVLAREITYKSECVDVIVRLYRGKRQLIWEVVDRLKKTTSHCYFDFSKHLAKEDHSSYERIRLLYSSNLLEMEANYLKDFDVKPGYGGNLELEKRKERSEFDHKQTIDRDTWAITLVNSGGYNGNPKSLLGHAAIIVEGVEDGIYFAKKCHLLSTSVKCDDLFPKTGFKSKEDRNKFLSHKLCPRTETWYRSSNFVKSMLTVIEFEASVNGKEINKNTFSTILGGTFTFSYWGNGSVLGSPNSHNCMSWAKERLKIVGIKLPDNDLDVFVVAPKKYI